jgi:hypothetical protein
LHYQPISNNIFASCDILHHMNVDKISISFPSELGDEVREAASNAGRGLSSWFAEAATTKLRAETLAKFLDQWEREHGPFTADELARAKAELSLR